MAAAEMATPKMAAAQTDAPGLDKMAESRRGGGPKAWQIGRKGAHDATGRVGYLLTEIGARTGAGLTTITGGYSATWLSVCGKQ